MTDPSPRDEAVQRLAELVHDINIAALTTRAANGSLRSRPMATQREDFDGTLWFLTHDHDPKVGEIAADPQVNLSYMAPDDNRYVSISGRARLTKDQARIDDLWNPLLKAWFPDRKDDPSIAVIAVDVEAAEYWDAPNSKFVQLAGFVKSVATGRQYEPGDNEKLRL